MGKRNTKVPKRDDCKEKEKHILRNVEYRIIYEYGINVSISTNQNGHNLKG
jgi:hypothetical protein